MLTEQAGVSYVFVNLGSDHPSILEAMVKGQKEKKDQFPTIITCPNEVLFHSFSSNSSAVALSVAPKKEHWGLAESPRRS